MDTANRKPAAHGLAYLLGGLSPSALASEYWGARPLIIRGSSEKFHFLFDRDRFADAMQAAQAHVTAHPQHGLLFNVRASFERGSKSPPGRQRILIQPEQWKQALAAGATICTTEIEAFDAGLSGFAQRIKAELGYPGAVHFNCYYSPGGAGFSTHFDARVATTLQIEGRKRWRFAREPAVAWPHENGEYADYGSPDRESDPWKVIRREDFEEVTLEPGDLLMLPAGTWHEAEAVDGESLALNLAFEPFSPLTLVQSVLAERLGKRETWRGCGLHPRPDSLVVTAVGDATWAALIDEVIAELRALAADPTEIWSTWAQLTMFPPALVTAGASPDDDLRADGVLTPDTLLCVVEAEPRQFLLSAPATGGQRLTIALPPDVRTGTAAGGQIPLVEINHAPSITWVLAALQRRRFTLRDATQWAGGELLGPAGVRDLAADLIRCGILRPDRSG